MRPKQQAGTPLGQLLSLPGALAPVHAKTNLVSTPAPPPPLYRYGQQERGAAQSSRYTGGVVQSPYRPVENINTDFISPTYAPLAPIVGGGGGLAALFALGGGMASGARPGGGGSASGTPRPSGAPTTGVSAGTSRSPAGAPGSSGGYTSRFGKATGGTALGGYGGTYQPYNPQPNAGTPASAGNPTGGYSGGYVPLGTQLASAAVRGRRGSYYE